MKLILIPAGKFKMGRSEQEADDDEGDDEGEQAEEQQVSVTITKSFLMGQTEVTQGQWKAVMGTEPWKGKEYTKEGPNYAATYVNWDDATAFCEALSKKEGKTYSLPTEAQWEYACRAGTTTAYSFGDDESQLGNYAWFQENAEDAGEEYAHEVAMKKPSPWGLYDMHGNGWEWCSDWYDEKLPGGKDPTGPVAGSDRVLRGGSWDYSEFNCRSAYRDNNDPSDRYSVIGFRVVRLSE